MNHPTRPRSRRSFRRRSTSFEPQFPAPFSVVGGDSLIGSALVARARAQGVDVMATSRRPGARWRVDLAESDTRTVDLPPARAAAICLAMTDLRRCQADPAASESVNLRGCVDIFRQYAAHGTRCVFLSTNQVFDGARAHRSADDAPNPSSVYGKHKAAAESVIRASGGMSARLTKVVHLGLPVFAAWSAAWSAGEPCQAFDDTFLCPVPLTKVVDALARVLAFGAPGIAYHVSADEDVSYFEFAREIARAAGVPPSLVQAVKGAERLQGPAFLRPRYSSLDTTNTEALGWRRPDWRQVAHELAASMTAAASGA
ncbi:MAG: sugar nucleotide-binding protein [Magnetospirillum sp.]|nr:sugar nucleotide-binding protein [Magnetospirillum sp.]